MGSKLSKGFYNGFEVEFGRVYSNPMLSAFLPINEAGGDKKLRVFDFDDTLVKTNSNIYVKHRDGKEVKMSPGEYAVYEPKDGDKFDFSDFESVKHPQEIKGVTRLLKNILRVGGSNVVILTARSAYKPVKNYLKDVGIDNIFVVALADSDPQKKADWIEDKIKGGVKDVFFIDDSHKNVSAVQALSKKYPNISLKVRHVQHEIPSTPKQDKVKGGKKEKDFIKTKPMPDSDMKLKSLLPKTDLEKKIKNPDTGKMIKLGSALKYDRDTKAYKAAQFALKKK